MFLVGFQLGREYVDCCGRRHDVFHDVYLVYDERANNKIFQPFGITSHISCTIGFVTEKKVIVFVGMPGAGKSTCVEHLESLGLPSVYFGGITIDEVRARGLEVNEKNEKMVREDIRSTEGLDAYAKRIIAKIEKLFSEGHSQVVADGLYSWTEYKAFKQHFGDDALIIAITAPRRLRHERLARRPVRPLTDHEVTTREYAEIENLEKGGPIANADYTLINDRDPYDLVTHLENLLKELGLS